MSQVGKKKILILLAILPVAWWIWNPLAETEPTLQGRPVRAWLNDLTGTNQFKASEAAKVFREQGTNSFPYLFNELQTSDGLLRRMLVELHDRHPGKVPAVQPAWERRGRALLALHTTSDNLSDYQSTLLDSALGESHYYVIEVFIRIFQSMGDAGIQSLIQWLENTKEPEAIVNLLQGFSAMQLDSGLSNSTLKKIAALASGWIESTGTAPRVRLQAIRFCSVAGPAARSAVGPMLPFTDSTDVAEQMAAIVALGRIGQFPGKVLPRLQSKFNDPNQDLACAAIESAGRFGANAAHLSGALATLLETTPSDRKQLKLIEALGNIGPGNSEAVQGVVEKMQHPQFRHHYMAIDALERMHPDAQSVLPVLIQMLRHRDSTIAGKAASMLKTLEAGAAPAVPALRGLLFHDDEFLVVEAIQALGAIGPDAAPAIPDMKAAAGSNYSGLIRHVEEAIAKIQSEQSMTAL